MASTWVFKITASLIKPTRETLLDYCSYILIILSVIGIARVIIGNHDLKYGCTVETNSDMVVTVLPITNVSNNSLSSELDIAQSTKYCSKYYQAYFPYILAVESLVVFLIGILWVKVPKVQTVVHEFSKLLHESRKSMWFKNIATTTQSNSLLVQDSIEVRILLDALFQPNTNYSDKAKARCLYEKIQKFSHDHQHSKSLWSLYIRKSVVQLLLWIGVSAINIVLFVKLEFYIGCDTSKELCSHDTFLRIVWFMGELLFLVYGIFNCATLRWINDKSSARGNFAFCKLLCGISSNSTSSYQIQPYNIGEGQREVHNDMALLLHLVTSSNRKNLPYFTVFLFDEWNRKFSPSDSGTPGIAAHAQLRSNTVDLPLGNRNPPRYADVDEHRPLTRFTVDTDDGCTD